MPEKVEELGSPGWPTGGSPGRVAPAGRLRYQRLTLLCATLAWLLAGRSVAGQDVPAGDDPPPETPEQETPTFYATATVQARPLTSATATVGVVERESIEALGAQKISEALYYVPGLLVTANGSRGGLTTAQLRGGDPNFTLVLLDGVPLNDSTDQLGGAFNLAGLPTFGVERVEIVRGPLSSFFGSTGLAGAINIITRRGEGDAPAFAVVAEAGDAALRRSGVSVSGGGDSPDTEGGHDYFVGLLWEEEEESIASVDNMDNMGNMGNDSFEGLNLATHLAFRFRPGAELRLRGRLASWEADDYPEASGGPLLGSGELRQSDQRETSLGIELVLNRTETRQHKLYATHYRRDFDRLSPAIVPLVPESVEETAFNETRLHGSTTFATSQLGRLSFGADLERETGSNASLLFLPPFLGGPTPGDYDVGRNHGAAFIELVAERGDLVFELGSRLDVPQDTSPQWSPRVGISYRTGGGSARLRGSFGRAFKLPSFFALETPRLLGGNPELQPETALGGDVGIELDLRRTGSHLLLNFFFNQFRQLIDFDFETFQLVNRAEVEARGAELGFSWQGKKAGVETNVTWQQVEDQATSETLLHRPRWFGGAKVYLKPHETLRLHLDARVFSESLDEQIPVPGRNSVGGYQVMGLAGSWLFSPGWSLQGRVDNVTDKQYETFIGFPGPERRLRIGFRWQR